MTTETEAREMVADLADAFGERLSERRVGLYVRHLVRCARADVLAAVVDGAIRHGRTFPPIAAIVAEYETRVGAMAADRARPLTHREREQFLARLSEWRDDIRAMLRAAPDLTPAPGGDTLDPSSDEGSRDGVQPERDVDGGGRGRAPGPGGGA